MPNDCHDDNGRFCGGDGPSGGGSSSRPMNSLEKYRARKAAKEYSTQGKATPISNPNRVVQGTFNATKVNIHVGRRSPKPD